MESSRIRKGNIKKTATLKRKLERSDKLGGVLATKIEQSIARAKYVQSARKATWTKIDQEALEGIATTNIVNLVKPVEKPEKDLEKEEEDGYVKEFYADEEKKEDSPPNLSNNRFALLEVEE